MLRSGSIGCPGPGGTISLNRPFGERGPSWIELAQQALSSTVHGYDLLAPRFDATPFRTPDDLLTAVVSRIEPVDRALDLCCGTGAAMLALRPKVRTELVGVDLSQGMLDVARSMLDQDDAHASEPTVTLIREDVRTYDGAERFDLVVSFGAFGHFEPADQPALAHAVARALRPGGSFVFVTGEHPGALHPATWLAWGFNGAMRVRNALISPPFIMYYLTFLWPACAQTLRAAGLEVTAERGVLPAPYERALLVRATRPLTAR